MKTLQLLVASLAVLALVACGSKAKKDDTTPDTTEQVDTDMSASAETEPAEVEEDDSEPVSRADLAEVIYFEFDSSDLDEASRQKLNENAEWLREDSARTLRIEGHTDELGTPEYNIGLGERRARAAKDYLIRLGIEADRVDIISYGEERPASDDDSLNRRSVFMATRQ